jgi:hypothetical protein
MVEDQLVREGDVDQIAAGRMQNPLRLAGRARSVEDEEGILRLHRLGRTVGAHLHKFVVQPNIPAGRPRHLIAGAAHDQHLFVALAFFQGFVGILFERDGAAPAHPLIGGDDELRIGVNDAARQAVGREAAKYHRMHRADAATGEHGVGRFGNHRQINGDPVAFLDAVGFEHVGEL